jgi:UDP-glucuronate 4-epimerase
MNILVTGCAGFIGFSLSKKILEKKKYKVFGIDNINKYYSINLKKKRLSLLKKYKEFNFKKIDLLDKKKIKSYLNYKKIDVVFHFAAQAGVRYVKKNPKKFIDSNIVGFFNLLEVCKGLEIKNFFYASSSSVYGDNKKFPVNEKAVLSPKNIYGLTKKFNEEIVELYKSNITKYIGLRFFTVYGEWGRPDMLILKLLHYSKINKLFYLNNFGRHYRDFTHIDDVVNILTKIMNKNFKKNTILNVCSNKLINVGSLVNFISLKIKFKKIKLIKSNSIEVLKTHGDNFKIKRLAKYKKFSNIYKNIDNLISWFNLNSYLIK